MQQPKSNLKEDPQPVYTQPVPPLLHNNQQIPLVQHQPIQQQTQPIQQSQSQPNPQPMIQPQRTQNRILIIDDYRDKKIKKTKDYYSKDESGNIKFTFTRYHVFIIMMIMSILMFLVALFNGSIALLNDFEIVNSVLSIILTIMSILFFVWGFLSGFQYIVLFDGSARIIRVKKKWLLTYFLDAKNHSISYNEVKEFVLVRPKWRSRRRGRKMRKRFSVAVLKYDGTKVYMCENVSKEVGEKIALEAYRVTGLQVPV